MKAKQKNIFFYIPITALVLGMFVSCSEFHEPEESIFIDGRIPSESFDSIVINFTDSARQKARLYSNKMYRFQTDSTSELLSKDSLMVYFFDTAQRVETKLSALYGQYLETEEIIHLKNNVVFHNVKENQILKTQNLTWDQDSGVVYTPKKEFVQVIQKDAIINGIGLVANDRFSWYTMDSITGIVPFEVDEKDSTNNEQL